MRICPVIQIVVFIALSIFVVWYSWKHKKSVVITSVTLCLCIYKIADAWISNNLYSIMEYIGNNQDFFVIAGNIWNALFFLLTDIILIISLLRVKKHKM